MQNVLKNPVYGLLLAPGRGKTGIVLEAFRLLKKFDIVDELYVVSKVKIVTSTWPKEIAKWNFDFKYHVHHGTEKNLDVDADVHLLSFEGMHWLEKEFKRTKRHKHKRMMIVIDESSKIKNTKTARYKVAKRLSKLFDRRYIATGSPSPNGLQDLYGQIYFLDRGKALGEYITKYRMKYFYPCSNITHKNEDGVSSNVVTKWCVQEGKEKDIYKAISHLVMRLGKSDGLPPLTKVYKSVDIGAEAYFKYKELEKDFITLVDNGAVTAANAGVKSMKLRQIASGFVYDENGSVAHIHNEKIDALVDIVEELQGSPCIVAYEFNHELEAIKKAFPNAICMSSGISPKESSRIEDEWNKGNIEVLLGQTSSIAHGLNLQESGTHLIIFTMTWNLEDYEQLIQRLHREGQKNPVTVIHLVAENTVEDLVVVPAVDKKDVTQQDLLNALEKFYKSRERRGVVMSDKLVIEKFKEYASNNGNNMPDTEKSNANGFALGLMNIMHDWSHKTHQTFLEDSTGDMHSNDHELVSLFKKSKMIIFNAFDIEEVDKGGYVAKDMKLIHKYANKIVASVSYGNSDNEHLSLDKGSKQEKKMAFTTHSQTASKKKFAKKGGTISNKEVPQTTVVKPEKENTMATKKTVSKKKVSAKKAPAAAKKTVSKKKVSAKKAPAAAKKAVSKKKTPAAAKKTEGKQTIGGLVQKLILEKVPTDKILSEVLKKFPDASTSASNVSWYRSKLRSEGLLKN